MKSFDYTAPIHLKQKSDLEKPGIVYLFPGQGSARPNMFDTFLEDEYFIQYIEKANAFLEKRSLPTVGHYLSGQNLPEEHLALVRNLSLFACEVALFYKVEKLFLPKKLFGHSFGEFAALVCCGALTFEQGMLFVYLREISCPKNNIGGMFVIGKIKSSLEKICNISGLELANINSYNQHAYSFRSEDFERITKSLRKLRVPFVHLYNLKYPYHSQVMKESRDILKNKMSELNLENIGELKYHFYSYVTEKTYTSKDELMGDIFEVLTEQLVRPVHFVKGIENCFSHEEYSFFECGPDNTLEVLATNIYKENKYKYGYHFHHLPKSINQKKYSPKLLESKWFKSLGKVLSDVTGYKIKELEVSYDFQKDLGIDSIKKAEVLYRTLNAQSIESIDQISLSSFKTVGEFVEYMETYGDEIQVQKNALTVKTEFSLYQIIKDVVKVPTFINERTNNFFSLFSLINNSTNETLFEHLKNYLLNLKFLENEDVHFLLPIDNDMSYGVASFIKSYVRDLPVGLKLHFVSHEKQQLIVSDQIEIFYDNQVEVEKFIPLYLENKDIVIRKVIFIGGHKGLGKLLIEESTFLKNAELIVLGRSVKNKKINNITYQKVDITNEKDLKRVFEKIGEVDLVINGAGIEISKSLEQTFKQDFDTVSAVKYEAPVYIANYCAEKNIPFVQFSSVVSYFGGRGQYTYAYANEMTRVQLKKQRGQNVTINWPALDKIGMTENLGIYQRIKESGMSMLGKSDVIMFFDQILSSFMIQKRSEDYFILDPRDFYILDHHLSSKVIGHHGSMRSINNTLFTKTVNINNSPEYKDHNVNEVYVYPGSHFMWDSFLFCYMFTKRTLGSELKFNIDIQNVALFHNGNIILDYEYKPKINSIHIKSNKVDYASIEFTHESISKKIQDIDIHFIKDLKITSLYNDDVITFGPYFQVINDFKVDKINRNGVGKGEFSSPWQLIEAGFQGLSILCGLDDGGLAVPQSISDMYIDMFEFIRMEDAKEYQVFAHMKERKNKKVVGSFSVFKKGKLIVHCEKLQSQTVRMFDKDLLIFKDLYKSKAS